MPNLSVIIPSYNSATFLPEAVESIRAQDWPDLEIIIVDDGSTDNTADIIPTLPLPVRYHRQENGGVAVARNTALGLAQGEFIAFLDADDIWPAGKLALQMAHMARTHDDMVAGQFQMFRTVSFSTGTIREFGASGFIWVMGCGIYRRSLFDRVGLFNPELRCGEDSDWFFRVFEAKVPHTVLPDITLFYRRHLASLTHTRNLVAISLTATLKMSLDRRRRAAAGAATPMEISPTEKAEGKT